MNSHQSKDTSNTTIKENSSAFNETTTRDAVIVGAGFSGLYQLYSLKKNSN